jgi:hypothetical protein
MVAARPMANWKTEHDASVHNFRSARQSVGGAANLDAPRSQSSVFTFVFRIGGDLGLVSKH